MLKWILILVFAAVCFAYYMSQKQRIRREQLRERRDDRRQELMEILRSMKEEKSADGKDSSQE